MTDKIFVDRQGRVVSVGDRVMYIVGNQHDVCYGTVTEIKEITQHCGNVATRVKVWKTHGLWHTTDKFVYLTGPTLFKCDIILGYPSDTKVEGT